MDSNGKVHISYYDGGTNDNLRHATNSSGSWTTELVYDSGNAGVYNSLGIDSAGNLFVAFSVNTGNVDLSTNASGSWANYTIESTGSTDVNKAINESTTLVLDSTGKVHVFYYDDGNDDLKYAVEN